MIQPPIFQSHDCFGDDMTFHLFILSLMKAWKIEILDRNAMDFSINNECEPFRTVISPELTAHIKLLGNQGSLLRDEHQKTYENIRSKMECVYRCHGSKYSTTCLIPPEDDQSNHDQRFVHLWLVHKHHEINIDQPFIHQSKKQHNNTTTNSTIY